MRYCGSSTWYRSVTLHLDRKGIGPEQAVTTLEAGIHPPGHDNAHRTTHLAANRGACQRNPLPTAPDFTAGTRIGIWDLRLQHADGRSESLLLDGAIPTSGGVRFIPYAPSRLEHYSPPGWLAAQPPSVPNAAPLGPLPEALRSYLVQTGKLLPGSS